MARFTQSPLTPNISGKIGGMSISSSQSGKVMKVSARPRRHTSAHANAAMIKMDYLLNCWRNLTQAQRDQWEQYSVFRPVEQRKNPGRYINGQQYFIVYNSALYAQFQVVQNSVNFATTAPFSETLSLTFNLGNFFLDSTANIDETTDFVIFKISAPMPPSRKQPQGGTKQIICTFANTNSISIAAAYIALFGAVPSSGDTCFVEYTFFKASFIQWSAPTRVKLIVS